MPTPDTAFLRLVNIMNDLREQCPWDKKQTIDSIRHLTIEETYELSDAILKKDLPEIKKELGDILLHVAMHGAPHRGQICSMLAPSGQAPALDYFLYALERPVG